MIRFDVGKSNNYRFNSATMIFIAREGEQVSWISNYLFHLISTNFVNKFFNIRIYITLKKNSETVPSFLFWRALLLIYKNNVSMKFIPENIEDEKEVEENEQKRNSSPIFKRMNSLQPEESHVAIKFGRPNFLKIFRYLCLLDEKNFHVYCWVPEVLKDHLYYTMEKIKRETGVNFKLIAESFS